MEFLLAVFLATAPAKPAAANTVTVTWLAKTPPTTELDPLAEHGSVRVPLTATEQCKARYRIERLRFVIDLTDAAISDAAQGGRPIRRLDIRIRKLFKGRGAPPVVTIRWPGQSVEASDFSIDVNEWPRKGYVIDNWLTFEKMETPKHWLRVEMACP